MYSWWWVELSPETCRVKPLRRINVIVASCWIYFTTISVCLCAGTNSTVVWNFWLSWCCFGGGFESSGKRSCTLGWVVRLWITVFSGWAVQEDVLTHVDKGITVFRKVGTHSPSDTASHLRKLESSTRQGLTGFSWNLVLENLFNFYNYSTLKYLNLRFETV